MSETDSTHVTAVPTKMFYGRGKLRDCLRLEKLQKTNHVGSSLSYPYKLLNASSPTSTWRVFKKQNEALEFAKERKNGVMTFVFHHGLSGERLFLVAHPLLFWYYDSNRKGDRCSYEIISENTVCKLYFDLEYNKELNPQNNGVNMTDTFIDIVALYLKSKWNISINRKHVLDLDSSTETKFSRHLIFQLPNAAFKDNYNVGNFVKTLCNKLMKSSCENEMFVNLKGINLKQSDINNLYTLNSNGRYTLFCDTSVYTKNRHFRLYRSSKWKKNVPLLVSQENKYEPNKVQCAENIFNITEDSELFLDSLITYFSPDNEHPKILEFGDDRNPLCVNYVLPVKNLSVCADICLQSPYPEVDTFIKGIVAPGRIHKWFYFSSGNHIVFNIVGFRYCNNIGREHQSNNIKYVVDLNAKCYYQKCYDPDCAGYRSPALKLPAELSFLLEDEGLEGYEDVQFSGSLGYFGIPDEELGELLDVIESEVTYQESSDVLQTISRDDESKFPTYGLSDSVILNIPESDTN